jgi:molybdopterin synthase catalytic subunit
MVVALFVVAGSFLIRYSDDDRKQKYRLLKTVRDYLKNIIPLIKKKASNVQSSHVSTDPLGSEEEIMENTALFY